MRADIRIYNEDCLPAMEKMKDNEFDLAIVDPPYRDENQPTKDMRRNGDMDKIQGRPDKKYWDELFRITENQIIWGANNFELPQWKGFVVWEKQTISESFTMSMCELASLSEALSTISKLIKIAPQGTKSDPRIHPTQKPVALYKWLLKNYAKEGDRILDTHLGSGSIALACWDMGFDLVGYELDPDYYKSAMERLDNHKRQGILI